MSLEKFYEDMYTEYYLRPVFGRLLNEEHLQEMADCHYVNGKNLINRYTRSNNSNSIKFLLTFIFIRQLGEEDGVRYYDENKQSTPVENWFLSIINDLSNEADEAQQKNLDDLKLLFFIALKNLRNFGWREDTVFPEETRLKFQDIIANTNFSITYKSQRVNKD